MIDTINLEPIGGGLSLAPHATELLFPPPGCLPPRLGYDDLGPWKMMIVGHGPERLGYATLRFTHQRTGMVIHTVRHRVRSIQASLSRVHFGSNGILIKTPEQLAAAQCSVLREAQGLLDPFQASDLKVTRIDLALNLCYAPSMLMLLHRHARHPSVRRPTRDYYSSQGSTLWGRGDECQFKFYDKEAEVAKHSGRKPVGESQSTRVEVSLRRRQLLNRLCVPDPLRFDQLEFWSLYRCWRTFLCEFESVSAEPIKCSQTSLYIASLLASNTKLIGGMDPWDHYCQGKSSSMIRQKRREVIPFSGEMRDSRGVTCCRRTLFRLSSISTVPRQEGHFLPGTK